MKKIVFFTLAMLIILCGSISAAPITFFNSNPTITEIGIAKFILNENGEKIDYEILNIRWSDKEKIIELEPGEYGITKYCPITQTIIDYIEIEVKDEPITVKF